MDESIASTTYDDEKTVISMTMQQVAEVIYIMHIRRDILYWTLII